MQEVKLYMIKETGDVLQYIGEVLTDPHKGGYDSEYKVIKGKFFVEGIILCEYELYGKNYKPLTLEKLSEKTTQVLYGR